jgi:HTH-type transcriptional regulator/antitoxin HigA
MEIKPIKKEKDYNQALERLKTIFDSKLGPAEGHEPEVLGILIDQYENESFPIGQPDTIEAIKCRVAQMGYNQNDLANIVGLKSRANKILNRKKKLPLEMIHQLHERLNTPTDVQIETY